MFEHNIINLEINKYVLNEDPGAFVLSIVVQDFKKKERNTKTKHILIIVALMLN